jgi:hypothetical protein
MHTLDKLQDTDFLPYINQTFRVRLDGIEPIVLELVNVTESGIRSRPETRRPSSLHFLGPVSPQYLVQHTYRLEHEQMGAFDLFIVPLGPETGRMRYEVIFT